MPRWRAALRMPIPRCEGQNNYASAPLSGQNHFRLTPNPAGGGHGTSALNEPNDRPRTSHGAWLGFALLVRNPWHFQVPEM
eukprot:5365379-Alexandrium_andersonii.AAC.1